MPQHDASVLRAIVAQVPESIVEDRVLNPDLPDVRGQFREGSLMFADVSGFTAMSEKLSRVGKEGAEELTEILNGYFSQMLGIVSTYHGAQLKFGGDAMLVAFLGPGHAVRAARCALKMQAAMRRFKRLNTSQGVFTLRMSIGINTDEFFEAVVGVPGERLYCVFTGYGINRTAEIEAAANADEVLISARTFRELGDGAEGTPAAEERYLVTGIKARARNLLPFRLMPESADIPALIERLTPHLPGELADRIRDCREAGAAQGEHRRVTVMFVNLLGASEVVAQAGSGETGAVTQALNDYFQMVHQTVQHYGGTLIGCDLNTKGDKLLIVFGAPVAHEDDDERALMCALEMQQKLADSNLEFRQRIGINTGAVFSGELGSANRKEYTVMGDHVNLAARLLGVAQEGEIMIGQTTYDKVAGVFELEPQPPVKVKGKSQPVMVYRVVGMSQDDGPRRETSHREILGRETELSVLAVATEQAFCGQGQVLAVSGAAGVGKSRLAEELTRLWDLRGGSAFSGECQSYGAHIPFHLWSGLMGDFFGLQKTDTPLQRVAKVEAITAAMCPELVEWTALLGEMVHAPVPESELLKGLDPKLRHQRLIDAVLSLLLARSQEKPLLILCRDLHWADSASLELLNYVVRNVSCHPVLVCAVYRPDTELKLVTDGQANYREIILDNLSDSASLEMVRAITRLPELPVGLADLVTAKARGNPLFIEELVGSLIDTGHLVPDDATGVYQVVGDLREVEVPDTVQAVIMARLDQLPEETRNVLRVSAVVGELFQYPLLKDIYPFPISERDLRQRLSDLAGLGLIIRDDNRPGADCRFNNVLTREVAYESLLYAQRRNLHHHVGEYYETHYGGSLEEHYELLFYHYWRTQDKAKSLDYAVRAGDKSKRRYVNEEAIGYYRSALELIADYPADTDALKGRVEESLGDIHELIGEYDLALEIYAATLDHCQTLVRKIKRRRKTKISALVSMTECEQRVVTLRRKRGMVYERKGQYDSALEWLDQALQSAPLMPDEEARLCTARAGVLYRRGEHAEALEWCQRGLEVANRAGDLSEVAHSHYLLGTIYVELGNVAQAIRHRLRALRIYEKTRDLLGQAKVHNNLGVDHYYKGDWEKAKTHYQRSLEIRQQIGDVSGVATVANNLGEVLNDQGYLAEASESFSTCLHTWQRIGYTLGVGLSHYNLGRICIRQAAWRDGLRHLMESVEIFERLQAKGFLTEIYPRLAEAHLGNGDVATALEYGERALALAAEQKLTLMEAVTQRVIGQIRRAQGDWRQSETLFAESRRTLQKARARYELSQTHWQFAQLLRDMENAGVRGRRGLTAAREVQAAKAIFEKLGVKYDARQAADLAGAAPASGKRDR